MRRTALGKVLPGGEWPHGGTSLGHEAFSCLAARIGDAIGRKPAAPLFRHGDCHDRASDCGSCRSLTAKRMPCMVSYRTWTGSAQEAPQGVFEIGQTADSRNIGAERGMLAGASTLPTGLTAMGNLAALPRKEAGAAVGGVMAMGRMHVEIEKPVYRESGNGANSGKASASACSAPLGCAAPCMRRKRLKPGTKRPDPVGPKPGHVFQATGWRSRLGTAPQKRGRDSCFWTRPWH